MSNQPPQLDCRFYRKKFPENDELVRVRIIEKEPHGFRCVLLEYNNIEGLVLLNELRRGRVRSYNKILRKNKEYTVLVLRVHMNEKNGHETGFPDLSLKAVPRDQLDFARDKWEKSKTVHAIMKQVARQVYEKVPNLQYNTIDLYEKFAWPMADKFGHVYLGLKGIMSADKLTKLTIEEREDEIKKDLELAGAPPETVDFFYSELAKRMKPTPKTVRALVEMKCLSVSAVDGIRKALQVAIDMNSEEIPIVVRVIAAPEFAVCCTTMDPQEGKKRITEILEKMKEALEAEEGSFKVTEEPEVETEIELLTKSDSFKKGGERDEDEEEVEGADSPTDE